MKLDKFTLLVLLSISLVITACDGEPAPPETVVVTREIIATPVDVTVVATKEATPTAVPIQVEEIIFQSDHFTLVGDLQTPDDGGKYPAIIMVHGDGGIDRYDSGKYRTIMERFLRAGYAVFSWDKPGTGESTGEFIDGAWIITDRASILVDAVESLKEHPAIDPERIGAWGISQGGYVIPLALTMTDDIAFVIVVSGPGVDSIDQTAYLIGQQLLCQGYSEEEAELAEQSFAGLCRANTYQEYRESKEYLIQFPYALGFAGRDLTPEEDWSPWDRSVDAFFNPIEVIEQTTIPVLAFFGEEDTQVDPFQGAQAYEEALQKAGNQNYRVELIPGVAHCLDFAETGCMDEYRPRVYALEYLDLMEEWLGELLETKWGEQPESSRYWPTVTWRSSTPEEQDMDSTRLEQMMTYIDEHDVEFDSVIVVRHGYIVLEEYFNGYNQHAKHHIQCVTKGFTSALIGIVLDKGLIENVDQKMVDLFPDHTIANMDARKQRITLEHLLTMYDGLDWHEVDYPYTDRRNTLGQM